MKSPDTARLGLRLIILGLCFVVSAPAIILFPGASATGTQIGIIWAVGMSLVCGITLVVLGLSLREPPGK
jgi:hypothetical protein